MKAVLNENLFRVKEGWVIISDEEIKENTNTFKEGLNGDWFFNKKYNQIARTGDITPFDFKIIATIGFNLEGVPYTELPDKNKVINAYNAEEMADEWSINTDNVHPADSYIAKQGYLAGFKAHQELVKDKLFTVEVINGKIIIKYL